MEWRQSVLSSAMAFFIDAVLIKSLMTRTEGLRSSINYLGKSWNHVMATTPELIQTFKLPRVAHLNSRSHRSTFSSFAKHACQ